jgi:hypothetical protein
VGKLPPRYGRNKEIAPLSIRDARTRYARNPGSPSAIGAPVIAERPPMHRSFIERDGVHLMVEWGTNVFLGIKGVIIFTRVVTIDHSMPALYGVDKTEQPRVCRIKAQPLAYLCQRQSCLTLLDQELSDGIPDVGALLISIHSSFQKLRRAFPVSLALSNN